jgi:hypothetical protein
VATIEFDIQLDHSGLEWTRVRFTTVRGRVATYTVQYETTLATEPAPVVRFDNAHGFSHQDVLNRRGELVEKHELHGNLSPDEALTYALRDIQENWRRYRKAFLEVSS